MGESQVSAWRQWPWPGPILAWSLPGRALALEDGRVCPGTRPLKPWSGLALPPSKTDDREPAKLAEEVPKSRCEFPKSLLVFDLWSTMLTNAASAFGRYVQKFVLGTSPGRHGRSRDILPLPFFTVGDLAWPTSMASHTKDAFWVCCGQRLLG